MTLSQAIAAFREALVANAKSGLHLDPELCTSVAELLAVYVDHVDGLERALRCYELACADEASPADDLPFGRPRTSAERRALARTAEPLDSTVTLFPLVPRSALSDGHDGGRCA